jgi:phage shock protein A
MALLERVSTLIRANLNDLIDRAEHPETMIKQVILDMENQLMQVKTQVAIAIADEHLLKRKHAESVEKDLEFTHRAELALDKKDEPLARIALERALSFRHMAEGFAQQISDQTVQVENLKSALQKLEQKLIEARAKSELLIAEHRRARALGKAADAHSAMNDSANSSQFDRMEEKVHHAGDVSHAKAEMLESTTDERLSALAKDDQVDKLLADLKTRRLSDGHPSEPRPSSEPRP